MSKQLLIEDKQKFTDQAMEFFTCLLEAPLSQERGEIEIRVFPNGIAQQHFVKSEESAAEIAYTLCNQGIDVYFGVNSRMGRGGGKDNVHWVNAFHAEIDYGTVGHKKESRHETREDALAVIKAFPLKPSVMVHSGGGYHCYWVLLNPVEVMKVGLDNIESINKALSASLGGDTATDISRLLRVPGTFNLKIPDNPRPVTVESYSGKRYQYEEFAHLVNDDQTKKKQNSNTYTSDGKDISANDPSVHQLPVSDKIKALINIGNNGEYISRSEADFAVIVGLVGAGRTAQEIKSIFDHYPIGAKYRNHNSPDQYLRHSIDKAKMLSGLSEEELANPLFTFGALKKTDKGYSLDYVKFEEYIVRKYKIRALDDEKTLFRYNGKHYEKLSDDALNSLCQRELGVNRNLFTIFIKQQFVHYAVGDTGTLIDREKAERDQVDYLTLQNGLFKLDEQKLIKHTPEVFTVNLLPYEYNPSAECPRFIKFLDEVFWGNKEKIDFIQEAVGYILHKAMPTPAVFFLVGGGSNGKSVFIDTLADLIGKDNTCTVSFSALSQQYYLLELFQKMLNISAETPHTKQFNTDIIKAVSTGDWVTGRTLYKQPMRFQPYAKHFLAMNKLPDIEDNSYGMRRRIYIIDFPRTFKEHEMDRLLKHKLAKELSGIFNWTLEGYKRLRENGFALKELPSMRLGGQYSADIKGSVRDYISERLERSDNSMDRLLFKDVYDNYVIFCQNDGKKEIIAKVDFGKRLQDLDYEVRESTRDANKKCVFKVRWAE